MTTIMRVGDKHHYASLASLAAMMITITTHPRHLDDHKRDYASLACQAESNGTLEMYIQKRLEKTSPDEDPVHGKHHYAS